MDIQIPAAAACADQQKFLARIVRWARMITPRRGFDMDGTKQRSKRAQFRAGRDVSESRHQAGVRPARERHVLARGSHEVDDALDVGLRFPGQEWFDLLPERRCGVEFS